jgi:hypothetical protein
MGSMWEIFFKKRGSQEAHFEAFNEKVLSSHL